MASRGERARRGRAVTASITQARVPRSLDVETRQKRYLITMGIRTACFIAMIFVPGWAKLVALAGAAVLPAVAVLLANASDNHKAPLAEAAPDVSAHALLPGEVIRGSVVDDAD